MLIFCVDGLHISVSSTIRTHKISNHRLATTSRNLDALSLVLYLVTCKITINCTFRNIPDKKHSLSCKTKRKKVKFILTDNQKKPKTLHTYRYICIHSLPRVYSVACYVRKSISGTCEEKLAIILFSEACIFGGKNSKDTRAPVCNRIWCPILTNDWSGLATGHVVFKLGRRMQIHLFKFIKLHQL